MIVATVTFDLEIPEEYARMETIDEAWVKRLVTLQMNMSDLEQNDVLDMLTEAEPTGDVPAPEVSEHDMTVIMGRRR